ncbi:hypothetical protein BGI05_02150 [Snodgrassella alvi]|uniref:hypothetical protein n=1 Tax=Snodgrassella alvi TaxID=1196083 RepID=UPI0009FD1846|nr:hypothetical protein [Snodgrassella alvi]ORE99307.1 hypothetical protein BGH97_10540 [Snodgrassella alvi]ORF08564.1 hypothetical protein BGH99_05435 [Snodgrassella alvi]ORF14091.1 hypothetical protein BGI00_03055 [Snodgrassella alvi]ORF16205.1 hypothetical protein BGI02_01080 [Snodgrassella alvi]ORF22414.1 hypothetical protein BGI05_02150 [Snodgrassella alvi]
MNGTLDLYRTKIKKLPKNLFVKNELFLSNTRVKTLPSDLKVEGDLWLSSSSIKKLPDNLKLNGDLYLQDTNIKQLPKNLFVKRQLSITNTKISVLPEDLMFGSIELDIKKIKNIVYKKCHSIKAFIFTVYLQGEIKLVYNGSLIGNLEEFEQFTDKLFLKAEADEFKQMARDCAAQLKQKLSLE